MKRRFVSLLAVLLLGIAGALSHSIPVNALPVHNCPDNTVCLYQWVNFGADRWQSSFYNISIHTNDCLNLTQPMAYWDNGTQVTDNSGSLVVNGNGSYSPNVGIIWYNWANCNSGGGSIGFSANTSTSYSNLTTVPIGGGLYAYHTLTSVKIVVSCPPSGCKKP